MQQQKMKNIDSQFSKYLDTKMILEVEWAKGRSDTGYARANTYTAWSKLTDDYRALSSTLKIISFIGKTFYQKATLRTSKTGTFWSTIRSSTWFTNIDSKWNIESPSNTIWTTQLSIATSTFGLIKNQRAVCWTNKNQLFCIVLYWVY